MADAIQVGEAAGRQTKEPTPLAKLQLAIAMLIQVCDPLTSPSIYPYINQLASELTSGDERKESLFFATEAVTILQWSSASDHIGRKPILLIGLLGFAISMLCFGLPRIFWMLVISRCFTGLLDGSTGMGVMKSALGDLTDPTNRARGFAYIPLIWAIGASLGPFIGGSLSRPHKRRFPKMFTGEFWTEFMYFLPCIVIGGFVFFSFWVILLFFEETIPRKNYEHGNMSPSSNPSCGPLPLRQLLTFPILVFVSNYVALAFLNIALAVLFLAMPIDIPHHWMYSSVFLFSMFVRRFGERCVFTYGLATCLPIFALFPIISLVTQNSGVSLSIRKLVGCLLLFGAMMDSSFGVIFMHITASAPEGSRGSTAVSIARAIGPALATSLFSLSPAFQSKHGTKGID
ncbi:major facilitator superfamily domain-containing protein [Mycena rosella]|uniref:Major facilitator superfamily domain-containing protein n=1 Tax=Mycena rosella TaxID=1033263 RepID=A0AAD7DI45_MYCRO|nr:major facilitator superfamily domain-containing protein [Mycena rosella]